MPAVLAQRSFRYPPQSYSTTFALTENPISESGRWQHQCPFLTTCQTAGGRVYGNQPLPPTAGVYEDAYAILTGTWPTNQRAEGIIDKQTTGGYEEYEVWVNAADAADFVRGYEVYVHQAGDYFALTIWLGTHLTAAPTIAYFDLTGAGTNNITAPQDGDLLWAQRVGNIITGGINGTTYLTFDVTSGGRTPFTGGAPAIGFDAGGSGAETANTNYGFKSFYATGL